MRTASPIRTPSFAWLAALIACWVMICAPRTVSAEDAAGMEEPDSLTANWTPRRRIEEAGISPFARLTFEGWGNVSGGSERGGWWNSLLDFGLELDTAKLDWWEGGTFVAQVHWVENLHRDRCFGEYTGAFNPVSGIEAGNQVRVFNLHCRHSWREDQVVLKLGQIAVDDDFMASDYAGLFLNSGFGAMPSQVGTPLAASCGNIVAFPVYSVAAPGVYFQLHPSEAAYTQLGLYYGRPGFDEPGNHGFEWVHETPAELGLFWESGYTYRMAARPATARLGLSYHTGPLDDFSANSTEARPATRQTVPNFYLIHDLGVLLDAEGRTKLGLFARGGITPEPDKSMVAWYADGGVNWFGPWHRRKHDVAGIGVLHTSFGESFRHSTGPGGVAGSETAMELTYRAQVTPWLAFQADMQLLFNPAPNPNSGTRETAMVIGLRADATF